MLKKRSMQTGLLLSGVAMSVLGLAAVVHADELRVIDRSGETKLVADIKADKVMSLEVHAKGTSVTLSGSNGFAMSQELSAEGRALFSGIKAGKYTVSSDSQIVSVQISDSLSANVANISKSAVGAGGLAAAGVAAVGSGSAAAVAGGVASSGAAAGAGAGLAGGVAGASAGAAGATAGGLSVGLAAPALSALRVAPTFPPISFPPTVVSVNPAPTPGNEFGPPISSGSAGGDTTPNVPPASTPPPPSGS